MCSSIGRAIARFARGPGFESRHSRSMFFCYNDIIEVVSEYVYLGVTMNYNNECVKAMRKQLDQVRKAQFSMLIKCRKLELPIDIQCELFESDRAGLSHHNIPSSGVLMKSIGAAFFDQMPFLSSTTCVGCNIKSF